ncbi:ABC transporter permease [Hoeflea sp. G2-23]|uniref:ABC transporter permease n=1 Tax=Hoeflea algicola TaxID=2983763 RepID=A0ABT3ZEF6_9HYPH|nr:ABC transporter permease [Hoeflea algicola]MCY0150182.1 ABC transporter permease [Hoeflea algicola]
MLEVILRRVISIIPVLFGVSLITFGLIHIIPGDPAIVIAGPDASADQVQSIRELLELDRPLHIQMGAWYMNLFQGDLGNSFMLGRSVVQAVQERLPTTLLLTTYSIIISMPIGIAAGLLAAYRQNTWVDTTVMTVALLGVSVPSFWLSIMGILVFSVALGWLPSSGYVPPSEGIIACLRSLTLPAISLAVLQIGLLARMTRATTLEVLRQDFIRTARAKGVSEWKTVGRHALSNVMIPIVTVVGLLVNIAIAGAVVIEQIFVLPGVGQLVVQGILRRDYPVIQGSILAVAVLLVLINLVVDLLYAYLDPRLRND